MRRDEKIFDCVFIMIGSDYRRKARITRAPSSVPIGSMFITNIATLIAMPTPASRPPMAHQHSAIAPFAAGPAKATQAPALALSTP